MTIHVLESPLFTVVSRVSGKRAGEVDRCPLPVDDLGEVFDEKWRNLPRRNPADSLDPTHHPAHERMFGRI